MKKKKKKILISVIAIMSFIVMFCFILVVFFDKNIIKYYENKEMSINFKETIKKYIRMGEDVKEIQIYSFNNEVSPVKMLCIQNMYGLCDIELQGYEERNNIFRYSVEKTIYTGRNCIDVKDLDNTYTEEEYYEIFRAARLIGDDELMSEVKQKYKSNTIVKNDNFGNYIYSYLNSYYIGEQVDDVRLKEIVYSRIEKEANCEYVNIDIDTLAELYACIEYLIYNEDKSCNKWIQLLYSGYVDESNEEQLLFSMDMSFLYYTRNIMNMRKLLDCQSDKDLYWKLATEGDLIYQPVIYDISSPRNFAAYITAISYSGQKLSTEYYMILLEIYNQIKNSYTEGDFLTLYYVNYVAKMLKAEPLKIKNDYEVGTDYYLIKMCEEKKEFEELCNNADDIYQVLYYADVSKGSEELMNALEKVDIWGYKDEEDFPVLLNLYTIVMKRENMLEDREQMEIIEHIKKSDTPYGYSHNGAYDFMTSVYYSNIIYILNGGEDIGFR